LTFEALLIHVNMCSVRIVCSENVWVECISSQTDVWLCILELRLFVVFWFNV